MKFLSLLLFLPWLSHAAPAQFQADINPATETEQALLSALDPLDLA